MSSSLGAGWGEPGGRVGVHVRFSWKSNGSRELPQQPRERKCLIVAKCFAHAVGWVRVQRKHGSMEMPVSNAVAHVSPLLTAKYGADLEGGHVLQLFTSERLPVVSSLTMYEGEERLFSFEVRNIRAKNHHAGASALFSSSLHWRVIFSHGFGEMNLPLPNPHHFYANLIHRRFQTIKHAVIAQVTLPPVLPPSFKGKSFSVSYAIVVEAQLQGVGSLRVWSWLTRMRIVAVHAHE